MKLFCVTLFVLAHIALSARLQAADTSDASELAVKGSAYDDRGVSRNAFPRPVLLVPPPVAQTDDRVEELFSVNPAIESDPSILLDPDQPYPDINHEGPSQGSTKSDEFPEQSVAAPSGVGSTLGSSGTETGKSGTCKEGKPLGYRDTPTNCFFQRCHQMLLSRTRSCMCYWDNSASGSSALAS